MSRSRASIRRRVDAGHRAEQRRVVLAVAAAPDASMFSSGNIMSGSTRLATQPASMQPTRRDRFGGEQRMADAAEPHADHQHDRQLQRERRDRRCRGHRSAAREIRRRLRPRRRRLAARRTCAHRRYARYRARRFRVLRRYAARPVPSTDTACVSLAAVRRSRRRRVDRRLRYAARRRFERARRDRFHRGGLQAVRGETSSKAADTKVLPISVSVPVTKSDSALHDSMPPSPSCCSPSSSRSRSVVRYARQKAKCAAATCRRERSADGSPAPRDLYSIERGRELSSVASFPPMISGCTAVCESTGSHGVAFSIARVRSISVAEMGAPLVAFCAADDAQTRRHRMRHSRHRRGREDVRTRALHEPFDHGLMRDDERARYACRFTERADRNQIRRAQCGLGDCAAALRAEHAEAVRIVDDQPCAMLFREFEQTRQRARYRRPC